MTRANFSEFVLGAIPYLKSRPISSRMSMSRNKLVLSVLAIAVAARNITRSSVEARDASHFLASLTYPRVLCTANTIGERP